MSKEHLKELGKRLKAIREELGMKQKEFALSLRLSDSFICQIEKGNARGGYEFFFRLASHFNVSLDYLFYGRGEKFLKHVPGEKEEREIKEISEIETTEELLWLMEHSNIFYFNVMGYSSQYYLSNKKIITENIKRKLAKLKG